MQAIGQRLGRPQPDALLSVARESGGTVLVHLNSAGNALAVEAHLRSRGYRVTETDYDPYQPGNFGVQIRVSAGSPRPCAAVLGTARGALRCP